jgi:hypothetical protein
MMRIGSQTGNGRLRSITFPSVTADACTRIKISSDLGASFSTFWIARPSAGPYLLQTTALLGCSSHPFPRRPHGQHIEG